MTRGGQTKVKDEPQRTCVVTRHSADKAELVRFVVGPDVTIVPDISGKLPGRGIYVSPDRSVMRSCGYCDGSDPDTAHSIPVSGP